MHVSHITVPSGARAPLLPRKRLRLAARHGRAFADLRAATGLLRLAFTLGWLDIRLRYRGSMLGPFWLTLSTAVMIGALGTVYSSLFKMNLHEYLPFLALSLVLWNFLSALVSDACVCFMQAEGTIRSIRIPFFVYPVRTVARNVLILAHNVVVILAVYVLLDAAPGWRCAAALPGILLWIVDGLALCLLLGPLCARFRDVPQIVASVMQIAFFVTPVIWQPAFLGKGAAALLLLNPFFAFLEIVRAPLMGAMPEPHLWAGALAYSAALWVFGWLVFAHTRSRLAFWV